MAHVHKEAVIPEPQVHVNGTVFLINEPAYLDFLSEPKHVITEECELSLASNFCSSNV